MRRLITLLILFMLAGIGVSFSVQAEAKPKQGKVIRLEALKIEGRIQKPEAFYILQRANLRHSGLEKPESFLPKIVESLESEPF
ncbi:MAG: hypothetical protein Kow0090_04880 [Myxococcota bacterium]